MNISIKKIILIIIVFLVSLIAVSYYLNLKLIEIYKNNASSIVKDRNEVVIAILPNNKNYFAKYTEEVPEEFKNLVILKEDRYFKWHLGINPVSTGRALLYRIGVGNRKASSTITQQLIKVLLENELERNASNKIKEFFYVVALEIFQNKETILLMYANSIYFGNQVQGIETASNYYFNVNPEMLSDGQIIQLISSISSPSRTNPASNRNKEYSLALASNLGLKIDKEKLLSQKQVLENTKRNQFISPTYFEAKSFTSSNTSHCNLSIDSVLQEKIREIVKQTIYNLRDKNVTHASVVVLKTPENELLSIIGTPNPQSFDTGHQINMAMENRSIGSTIKPLIYLKSFEKGLRPYTIAVDREYRYITAMGFPLYPKNFDYKYRGEVTLHSSLSNSLNVPSVKVLEYVGLEEFYSFLEDDLKVVPVQDFNVYQLGIALGNFELSLYNLTHILSILPNNGVFNPILKNTCEIQPNNKNVIIHPQYVQLVNKILKDRKTSIDQFGFYTDFNLPYEHYALKTGTSRDFRDSWIIGYSPDFIIGVWVGNADLTPMKEISGQSGAGKIWAEVMQLLLHSKYNKKTPFDFSMITEYTDKTGIFYGLPNDDIEYHQNILLEEDNTLILTPHDGDYFLFKEEMNIILTSSSPSSWYIDGKLLSRESEKAKFTPSSKGSYVVTAKSNEREESITIIIGN